MKTPASSVAAGARNPLLLGIVACLLAASAAGAAFAFTSPLFSSSDESAHVDYAYQVWGGSLPEFHEGLVIRPGFGFIPPVQWVAQHPPLYYVIQAPVVGPLIDSHHYLAAGYAARGVNALLAALLVGAVAWASAQVFPRRPQIWLAASIVAAMNSWVVRVGGSVYNDLLCALLVTLLLGQTVRILHRGETLRRVVLLAITAAAAFATRASVLAVVGSCLVVLVIHAGLSKKSWRSGLGATGRYSLVGFGALLPSAWFYLHNLRVTGHVLGGDPVWAQVHLHRTSRSTLDVVTDPQSWNALMAVFSYGVFDRGLMMGLLLGLPLVVTVAAFVLSRRNTARSTRPAMLTSIATQALLGGTALVVVAMQFKYAAGGGGLNPRYMMPLVLAISLAVGYGLSERRAGLLLLAPWAALAFAELVAWVARGSAVAHPPGTAPTFPVAAWAAVSVCAVAITIALACQDALGRASRLQKTDAHAAAGRDTDLPRAGARP